MPTTIAKTSTGIGKLNTNIWKGENYFQVQLYSTVVYDEQPDKITLRHGGWVTQTTCRRINQAFAYRNISNQVGIRKGVMVLHTSSGYVPFENGECVIQKQRASHA